MFSNSDLCLKSVNSPGTSQDPRHFNSISPVCPSNCPLVMSQRALHSIDHHAVVRLQTHGRSNEQMSILAGGCKQRANNAAKVLARPVSHVT